MTQAFIRSLNKIGHRFSNDWEDQETNIAEPVVFRGLSHGGEHPEIERLTDDEVKERQVHVEELKIVLIFAALLLGGFTKLCTKRLHLPFTPVVTLIGISIAEIDLYGYRKYDKMYADEDLEHMSTLRQTSDSYHFPEPKLIFLIFLPALIFESAFGSDWYTFKR